ncbi:sentrin-specific protease 7-like isoform X1 [Scyliorhinus torazame]|uniref:sentrin-specific protease 7-like isoform X1 n=2 Tax=Scyliorhinus torazame TaxID=75743 RepID=UPI003B5A0F01
MDRRRGSTQPAGQDGSGTLKSGGRFKIPKKKKVSEMDSVETHSPLSRLPDSRIENLKTSHKRWPFSYNTFNKTRNQDSIVYNQRRNCRSKHNFPQAEVQFKEARIVLRDVLMTDSGRQHLLHLKKRDCNTVENTDTSHAKHHTSATSELKDNCHVETKTSHQGSQSNILSSRGVQSEKRSESCIQKRSENLTRPKENSTSPGRNSKKEAKGVCGKEQIEKRDHLCEPNKINEDKPKESPLPSPKKKRLCTDLQDHSSQRDINNAAQSQKDAEDLLKKLLVCLTCKEQTENCHCFSTDRKNGQEIDPHLMEITQPESYLQQGQLSPFNTKPQSPNYRDQQLVSNDSSTPDGNINRIEPLHTPVINEQNIGARILRTPTSSSQIKHLKPAAVSSEPIVLSSDDEDADKVDPIIHCTTLTPEIKHLCLGSRMWAIENSKRETVTVPVPAKSEPETMKACTLEKDAYEVTEKKIETDCSLETSTMTKETLDLTFAAVHMGKIEGNEQGSVMFGHDNIAISFSDLSGINHSLLLNASHLKKYSVWEGLSDTVCGNHSIIFLWFAADYIDEVNKQSQTSPSKHDYKCNEFIFIQLFKPLQTTETAALKKIMTDISEKHEITDLCDVMPLDETYQLLANFSSEQSSLLSCCKSLQQQVDMATVSQESNLSQEENASPVRPNNYTLCHMRRKGQYMVSIASKQEKEKHTFRQSGPVQKIIVFPPPPTKGGLAVTTEDLECLEEGEFLNDVIIDFYLKYLLLEKAPKELAEHTHIFSSFFYRRLTRKDNAGSEEATNLSIQHKRHQRVRTWTRHVDIFTKDFVFVPVNEESHWYLAVICFPALDKIVYETDFTTETNESKLLSNPPSTPNDEKMSKEQVSSSDESDGNTFPHAPSQDSANKNSSSVPCVLSSSLPSSIIQGCIKAPINLHKQSKRILKQPCILILDSLRAASQLHTVKILREYLQIEWEVKKRGQRNFTAENMKGSVPRVPKQDNSSDCGIYLLQYVESFFQKPIANFELPLQLDKWFLREEVKKKREEIRDLILHLHSQQRTDS